MSVEAIAYVKSLDLGGCEKARLLMYVIGENTFNDTFVCVVGQKQLAYEARAGERTVRRQIDELVSARILIRKERYPEKGGRLFDALRIVGYKKWYLANNKIARRKAHNDDGATGQNGRKALPAKMAGSPRGLAAKVAGRATGQQVAADTGQQVAGTYKDTRTYPVQEKSAHERASEDSKFDLEGKGVRDRLLARHGESVFRSWFADVIFRRFDAATAIAETDNEFKRSWLRGHYEQSILDACRAEFGADITRIDFVWPSRKGFAA